MLDSSRVLPGSRLLARLQGAANSRVFVLETTGLSAGARLHPDSATVQVRVGRGYGPANEAPAPDGGRPELGSALGSANPADDLTHSRGDGRHQDVGEPASRLSHLRRGPWHRRYHDFEGRIGLELR